MTDSKAFTPFSKIIGQDRAINFLKQVMASEKIPHAYLFVGIPGVGKTTTAVALTQAINCHAPVNQEGCGQCKSCRQLMGGNFPDLEIIRPDGQNIKIEQIRKLNRSFGFKPMAGRYRISIVHQAERMRDEAANAFLKTLEEPPEGNVLILNVTEPLNLLPTIVSRCQKVPFRPIPARLISDWLLTKKDLDEEKALVLARLSGGSLGRALEMWESDFLEKRQDCLFNLIKLTGLSLVQALELALESTGKDKKREIDASGDGGIFGLLSIWKTWYRDLLVLKTEGPEELLINVDFSHKLKNIEKSFKIENLINSILIIEKAQRDLLHTRNMDLMMENTVLALKRLAH
ncbi:DNA polymerase III subunit delta' [bacterium]|nr:DNA polymerase III subunit delta' [bacterium]